RVDGFSCLVHESIGYLADGPVAAHGGHQLESLPNRRTRLCSAIARSTREASFERPEVLTNDIRQRAPATLGLPGLRAGVDHDTRAQVLGYARHHSRSARVVTRSTTSMPSAARASWRLQVGHAVTTRATPASRGSRRRRRAISPATAGMVSGTRAPPPEHS